MICGVVILWVWCYYGDFVMLFVHCVVLLLVLFCSYTGWWCGVVLFSGMLLLGGM